MTAHRFHLILFLLAILFFMSCKDQSFTKTKNATTKTKNATTEINDLVRSSSVRIKSYILTYNPKSNGFIKLELEDGTEYRATSVDGGSFSSINSLLKEPEVLFDTIRKEVVINKSIQN